MFSFCVAKPSISTRSCTRLFHPSQRISRRSYTVSSVSYYHIHLQYREWGDADTQKFKRSRVPLLARVMNRPQCVYQVSLATCRTWCHNEITFSFKASLCDEECAFQRILWWDHFRGTANVVFILRIHCNNSW